MTWLFATLVVEGAVIFTVGYALGRRRSRVVTEQLRVRMDDVSKRLEETSAQIEETSATIEETRGVIGAMQARAEGRLQ